MEFLTTKQASELWGISPRRIAILCEQGRITGAVKAGKTWLLPPDAQKPMDKRLKSNRSKAEEE
ncbi:MAG: helix-turn-helix domain-containing protein [Ruthenibacterium sp.]